MGFIKTTKTHFPEKLKSTEKMRVTICLILACLAIGLSAKPAKRDCGLDPLGKGELLCGRSLDSLGGGNILFNEGNSKPLTVDSIGGGNILFHKTKRDRNVESKRRLLGIGNILRPAPAAIKKRGCNLDPLGKGELLC